MGDYPGLPDRGTVALVGATGAIGESVAAALRPKGQRYGLSVGRGPSWKKSSVATRWRRSPSGIRITRSPSGLLSGASQLSSIWLAFDTRIFIFLMRRVINAAISEKVDRLLLIGTLYVFGRPQSARVTEDHPKEPHTFKGRKRKEQENRVLEAHTTARIRTTVLRLPDFYGPGVERSLLSDLFVAAKQNSSVRSTDRTSSCSYPTLTRVTKLLDTTLAFGRAWNPWGRRHHNSA